MLILLLIFAETICDLPQSKTKSEFDCLGMFYRSYYYNKEAGVCQKVTYGGCDRTANNFSTLEECEEACDGYE